MVIKKYLIYYPQEHFADKPMTPRHKSANIAAGLTGAETILFGLVGFQPQYNGELLIDPQLLTKGKIYFKGFKVRDNRFDLDLSAENMKIHKNGVMVYDGKPFPMKL